MKLISGRRKSVGLPSRISNLVLIEEPQDLLWRYPVDALGPGPHELDAAAEHDEGLETVGSQDRPSSSSIGW